MADPTECEHGCFSCTAGQVTDALRDLFLEVALPIVDRIAWLEPKPWVAEHLRRQKTLTMLVAMGLSGHEARTALTLDTADMTIFVRALVLGATTDEAWDALAAVHAARWTPEDDDV